MPSHNKTPRWKQFCAEAETFPTHEFLAYLTEIEGISQMRFCSTQRAGEPQLLKHGQPWQGGALIFFKHLSKNGLAQRSWERLCNSLLMRPVYLELHNTGKNNPNLWRRFSTSLEAPDRRQEELQQNIIRTNLKNLKLTCYMSQDDAEAAAKEQEEARAQATAEAAQACEEAEEAATAAVVSGPLTDQDCRSLKRTSWQAMRNYIQKKSEQEMGEYFAGQPSRKRHKGAAEKKGYKSKKPEAVAARESKLEKQKEKQAAAVAKEKKRVTFREPDKPLQQEPDKPLQREPERAPCLTIAQRVVHRALPQPAGQEWKYDVASFFQSRDVFSPGRKRGGEAVSALRRLMPQDCVLVPFFHTRNRSGLGFLFPAPQRVGHPNWPSALELHRAALRLERAAESLLRACAGAVTPQAARSLPREDAADLQLAWRCRGGVAGEGPAYWAGELDAGLFPLEGLGLPPPGLAGCLSALREGRRAAFSRAYLVEDEVTWCLPYLAKVYFMRSRPQPVSQAELRYAYERATQYRACALRADTAPLAAYGRGMLAYAGRLAEIARRLGLDDLADEVLPELEAPRQALEKAGEAQADAELVACRAADEAREARCVLEDLGLRASPALEAAGRLREALAEAMRCDSHQRQATMHLHPSPCLPCAAYEPGRYLQGGGLPSEAI